VVGSADSARPLVFIIAGEPSGDVLGARLMASLRRRFGGGVRFAGVGGPQMQSEGLNSLFPMQELSLLGAAELLPHLPRLLRRIRETAAAVSLARPDTVLSIDAPGFSFRVGARLAGQGIPLVHYVAPQVWAWRPGRARKIAGFLDHLLALFPFEPPHFEAVGLPCTFVGHPVLESGADEGDGTGFRIRAGIAGDAPVVCLLPGSRRSEIRRLLPVFGRAAVRMAAAKPGLRFVLPAVASLAGEITRLVAGWPLPEVVVCHEEQRFDAFAAADVALAASGTVALELAMAGTPTVIAYRLSPATAWLVRRAIRVPYVNLVNILVGERIVPELLQGDCRPELLAAEVLRLFDDGEARARQRTAQRAAVAALGNASGQPPSERAAQVIAEVIAGGTRLAHAPTLTLPAPSG
jgi:lipid-A-disaccharide synthase